MLSSTTMLGLTSRMNMLVLGSVPSVRYGSSPQPSGKDLCLPKRPAQFMMYLNQVRPELVKQNPNASVLEISKLGSKLYSQLPEDKIQALKQEYEEHKKSYFKAMEALRNSEEGRKLLDARKREGLIKRLEKKLRHEKALVEELSSKLGMPKKPPPAAFLYSSANSLSGLNVQSINLKYTALPEAEKEHYKAENKRLTEKYKAEKDEFMKSLRGSEEGKKLTSLMKQVSETRAELKQLIKE